MGKMTLSASSIFDAIGLKLMLFYVEAKSYCFTVSWVLPDDHSQSLSHLDWSEGKIGYFWNNGTLLWILGFPLVKWLCVTATESKSLVVREISKWNICAQGHGQQLPNFKPKLILQILNPLSWAETQWLRGSQSVISWKFWFIKKHHIFEAKSPP